MMRNAIFLFLILFLSDCTSDDDINPSEDIWVLNNVVCFCFFGEDFDFSVHSIRFDNDSGTVTIENAGDSQFIAPSGTYPFTDNGSIIGIEGREYTYEEDGDSLTLTYVDNPQIADDEITYYYSKD